MRGERRRRRSLPAGGPAGGRPGDGHGAAEPIGSETLLIDSSRLSAVSVDAERRVARAGSGATWAAVNAAAERHGLLGLAGTAGTVGIAGYTFAGGIGWLARPHGLASAHLRAVDFVDPAGDAHRAGERDDALWAFRGAGGVGVATALEFDLVPIGELWAGYALWPAAHAEQVVRAWAEALPRFPAALTSVVSLLQLPDAPGIPERLRGRRAVRIAAASVAGEDGVLRQVLAAAPASADTFGPCDATRLAAIHLDPPGPVSAVGEGRWLGPDAGRHALDILSACGTGPDCPLGMIEIRHVGSAETDVAGAMTSAPGPLLLHAVGDASRPEVEDALDEVRRAAAPVDIGRGAASFRDGRPSTPDALAPSARDRLARIHAEIDPSGLLRPPRALD